MIALGQGLGEGEITILWTTIPNAKHNERYREDESPFRSEEYQRNPKIANLRPCYATGSVIRQ